MSEPTRKLLIHRGGLDEQEIAAIDLLVRFELITEDELVEQLISDPLAA